MTVNRNFARKQPISVGFLNLCIYIFILHALNIEHVHNLWSISICWMLDSYRIYAKLHGSAFITQRKKRCRQSASMICISKSVVCFEAIFSSKGISYHYIRIYDPSKWILMNSRSLRVISDSLNVYL